MSRPLALLALFACTEPGEAPPSATDTGQPAITGSGPATTWSTPTDTTTDTGSTGTGSTGTTTGTTTRGGTTTPTGTTTGGTTTGGTTTGGTTTPPIVCNAPAGGLALGPEPAFQSTASDPTLTLLLRTTGTEVFSRLDIELDVTHGGWDPLDPTGTHAVFQLTRSRTWRSNLYGFMTMFGPNRNKAKVISNIDLPAGEITRIERNNVQFFEGETYHVHYTYDTGAGERRLRVTDAAGSTIVHVADNDVASEITALTPGYQLILGGDFNPNGPEVLTDGWTFENLCLQFTP